MISKRASWHWRRWPLCTSGAPRAQRTALLDALMALTLLDDTVRRNMVLVELGWNAFSLGDWRQARAYWSEGLSSEERLDPFAREHLRLAVVCLDALEHESPTMSERAHEALLGVWADGDTAARIYAPDTLAEVCVLAAGPPDLVDLRDRLIAVCADADAGHYERSRTYVRTMPGGANRAEFDLSETTALLAWIHLLLRELDDAERVLARAHQLADARGNRAANAAIWRVEALIAVSGCTPRASTTR